jgi:hypothetical protein
LFSFSTQAIERSFVMSHCIVWVDIPVADLDRAIAFYTAVLGKPVVKQDNSGFSFGLLPHANSNVSGCLYVPGKDNAPSANGPLVYLSVESRLAQAVTAAVENGGRVLQEAHQIGPHGWRAIILDSEGNRVALHAPVSEKV